MTQRQGPCCNQLGIFLGALHAPHCSWCLCNHQHYRLQVNIIPFAEYQVPEGNLVKEGSRKSRKREQYPPRAQMREQLQSPVPAATS